MVENPGTDTLIDLDRLLKLRVVVARFGELDAAKWWNTNGQLGRYGTAAVRRGLPRTHRFAQARSVFAVAARRCAELFDPPRSVTLWSLPAALEEEFDARWEHWLDRCCSSTSIERHSPALRPLWDAERCPPRCRRFLRRRAEAG